MHEAASNSQQVSVENGQWVPDRSGCVRARHATHAVARWGLTGGGGGGSAAFTRSYSLSSLPSSALIGGAAGASCAAASDLELEAAAMVERDASLRLWRSGDDSCDNEQL